MRRLGQTEHLRAPSSDSGRGGDGTGATCDEDSGDHDSQQLLAGAAQTAVAVACLTPVDARRQLRRPLTEPTQQQGPERGPSSSASPVVSAFLACVGSTGEETGGAHDRGEDVLLAEKKADPPLSPPAWECSMCTLINKGRAQECVMCGHERKSAIAQESCLTAP